MQKRRETKSYEGYPWHEANKEDLKRYAREYRANNPEYNARRAAKAKADRLADPYYFKAREFVREMKKYGTTTEWYRDKLVEQLGVCAICKHFSYHHGTLQRLQVDHDHRCCDLRTKSCGKCLRGLLCAECNILLSYLEKFAAEALVTPFPTLIGKRESWTGRAMRYLKRYVLPTQETPRC